MCHTRMHLTTHTRTHPHAPDHTHTHTVPECAAAPSRPHSRWAPVGKSDIERDSNGVLGQSTMSAGLQKGAGQRTTHQHPSTPTHNYWHTRPTRVGGWDSDKNYAQNPAALTEPTESLVAAPATRLSRTVPGSLVHRNGYPRFLDRTHNDPVFHRG